MKLNSDVCRLIRFCGGQFSLRFSVHWFFTDNSHIDNINSFGDKETDFNDKSSESLEMSMKCQTRSACSPDDSVRLSLCDFSKSLTQMNQRELSYSYIEQLQWSNLDDKKFLIRHLSSSWTLLDDMRWTNPLSTRWCCEKRIHFVSSSCCFFHNKKSFKIFLDCLG